MQTSKSKLRLFKYYYAPCHDYLHAFKEYERFGDKLYYHQHHDTTSSKNYIIIAFYRKGGCVFVCALKITLLVLSV